MDRGFPVRSDPPRDLAKSAHVKPILGRQGGVLRPDRVRKAGAEEALDVLDTRAEVETPERVRFRHQLAGPGRRAVAWAIDTAIRVVAVVLLLLVAMPFFSLGEQFAGGILGLFLVALFVLEWFYGAVFEILLQGRTPGKAILSLRVVRVDGSPIRPPDAVLRNLVRAVDYLPIWSFGSESFAIPTFGVAIASMLLDRRMRRIGDLVAGTVVVVDVHEHMHGGVVIEPPVSEEERQMLPAQVVLSRDEMRILESFVRRRSRLSRERAEELAELFGPVLSERTGIEAPTWERVLVLAYAKATGKDR